MCNLLMLSKFEVVENRSCSSNTLIHTLYTKSTKRVCAKLSAELIKIYLIREDPLLQTICIVFCSESISKSLLKAPLIYNLLRCKARNHLLDILIIALRNKELARSDVEESYTGSLLTKTYGSKIVVLLILYKVFAQRNSRSNKFNHSALNKTLYRLRIL